MNLTRSDDGVVKYRGNMVGPHGRPLGVYDPSAFETDHLEFFIFCRDGEGVKNLHNYWREYPRNIKTCLPSDRIYRLLVRK